MCWYAEYADKMLKHAMLLLSCDCARYTQQCRCGETQQQSQSRQQKIAS